MVRPARRVGHSPRPAHGPHRFVLVAGRLIARYGPALVISGGSPIFAAGLAWWALAVTTSPDYLSGLFAGMVMTG